MAQLMRLLCVCTLILLCVKSFTCALEKIYLSTYMRPGNLVFDETYVSLNITTLQNCIESCKLKKACKFVNYKVNAHMCYINSYRGNNSYSVNSQAMKSFVSSEKSQWNMTGYEDCDQCSENEMCVRHPNSTTSCQSFDCGTPPSVPDSEIFGNMFTTGSNIVYNCTGNSASFEHNATNIATCQSNGVWEGPGITCEETTTTSSTTTTTTTTSATTTTTAEATTTTVYIDDGYTEAVVEGVTFRYKITIASIEQSTASYACQSEGGTLYRPVTKAKAAFMRNFLDGEFPSSRTLDFWADARYDRTNDGKWKTSTLETVARTSRIWTPTHPNDESNQRCSRFAHDYDYYLENTYCSNRYLSYICEKP